MAMIEALLSGGASANTIVSKGQTVMMTAARTGNVAAVRVLLDRIISSVQAGAPHSIELDARPGLPEVFVDPDKFTMVVTNVVGLVVFAAGSADLVRRRRRIHRTRRNGHGRHPAGRRP